MAKVSVSLPDDLWNWVLMREREKGTSQIIREALIKAYDLEIIERYEIRQRKVS